MPHVVFLNFFIIAETTNTNFGDVKRYAMGKVKLRPYAVLMFKIRSTQYASGEGGFTAILFRALT